MQVARVTRSGPLPDSEEMARYEEIVPGAAERLIAMTEKEQNFSHSQTAKLTNLKVIGLISGTTMGLSAIGLAFYMVHEGSGSIEQVVYSIVAVIGVAITGRVIIRRKS